MDECFQAVLVARWVTRHQFLSLATKEIPNAEVSESADTFFTRQPENSKRAHSRVPAFKNTTKIPREDPQRERKTAKKVAGGKKGAKYWAVRRRGVRRRGVQRRRVQRNKQMKTPHTDLREMA